MSILEEIFANKRLDVAGKQRDVPLTTLRREAEAAPAALDFIAALRQPPKPALIAEIKRASPSKGLLLADFDPLRLARIYSQNGARAISILTEERYFQGHLDFLRQVRRHHPALPLLRKDFIFDLYQVYEARAAGADALLLIAAALDTAALGELQAVAAELGMAALVEVHTLAELEAVLPLQPRLVGVNNRDLKTFQVSLETTRSLRPRVPAGVTLVAESGINRAGDVTFLAQDPGSGEGASLDAILVGEALVTAPDIAARVRELVASELPTPALEDERFPSLKGRDIRRSRYCEG